MDENTYKVSGTIEYDVSEQTFPGISELSVPDVKQIRVIKTVYINQMNDVVFKGFTTRHMRIFMTILGAVCNQGCNKYTFSFSSLRKVLNDNDIKNWEICDVLEDIRRNLENLVVWVTYMDDQDAHFPIFSTLKGIEGEGVFEVAVNPLFKHFVNDFSSDYPFMEISLNSFNKLRSKHSQTLFRLLRQWRQKADCQCFYDIERLKKIMMLENMNNKDFNRDIITKSIKELNKTPEFKYLRIDKKAMKGQRPIKRIYFRWDRLKDGEDDV